MSSVEREVGPTEVALADEFREAIEDARGRVAAVLVPACPTPAYLAALRSEVEQAIVSPASVPHPELADADAYWDATVVPQSRAARNGVAAIVTWLEQRIIATMEVAETDLKALVDNAASDPSAEVEDRCRSLHRLMGEVIEILPSFAPLEDARAAGEAAMAARATADVESLREAYLRDAGGDEDHQAFAARQWAETFHERVAHRSSLLAAEPPWRHQEFALVGHERVHSEVVRLVEEAITRLQAPLEDLRRLLMERYDTAAPRR